MPGQVGIAIIGYGQIGALYAAELSRNPNASLIAVADQDFARAQRAAQFYSMCAHTTDYRQIINRDDVDLVLITTPNDRHCEPTMAAAAAGKHVFCDKPLATSLRDARAMVLACRRADVHLFYGEVDRFLPTIAKMQQTVTDGAIGRPLLLKAHRGYTLRTNDPRWSWWKSLATCGGGCLMDAGVHDIYNIRWLMGEVESVMACTDTYVHPVEGEDTAIVQFRFANGAMGVLTSTWVQSKGFSASLEVLGTAGHIRTDYPQDFPITMYSETSKAPLRNDLDVCWSYPLEGYRREMDHVVNCMRGTDHPLVTGDDGLAILKIVQAAYRSAAENRGIRIEDIE